tara:strand:+ start:6558 stop:7070 length:513 start_codon:yes stop_codon:yes gene_type:complete
MKTTEFHLKRVVIKSYDDDYGKWILCHEDFIITERGNNEIYIGMPNIFRDFEQMIEEEKIGIKKYASYAKHHKFSTIEIENLAMVMESELDTIKRVFKIEGRGAYIKTIYNKVKHYGGSEEGGWYYDTMEATKLTAEEVELDTDRYDQYYVLEREFYFGENENLESQHYC